MYKQTVNTTKKEGEEAREITPETLE